jgi:PAB1-binding protein PBP1
MTLDNKHFYAVKVSDVIRTRLKILKIIDEDIDMLKEGKLTNKESEEWNEFPFEEACAEWLENLREQIDEELYMDDFGDDIPNNKENSK